ncbi:hypothetical protein C5167_037273 [Papaver somniferum]|uniref:KIB1-4 beta-propeller domain-containing protein n=1 Tax=Papaver somniferum TaxID=3469 RepID=A0A4Y7IA01_PAPSO|nr:hypothetical protein C5167_037273 [Papaver somniferum]
MEEKEAFPAPWLFFPYGKGARDVSLWFMYFVECCDEFFRIQIYYNVRGLEKWMAVNSLGDLVLFVGRNTAYCLISELGLTRGCLYYTLPEDQGLYKFDVENATDSVILPCPNMPTPWFSSYWITLPSGRERKEGYDGTLKNT